MKQKKLTILAIILALFLLGVTIYTIYRLSVNRTAIEKNLQNQVSSQVSRIKVPKGDSGPVGLTGSSGNVGAQGLQGPQGVQGLQGNQGVQGIPGDMGAQGPVGPQGEQGPQGNPGDPAPPARETEFRCDPNTNDYEYRYVGDDGWQIIQKNSNACKSSAL